MIFLVVVDLKTPLYVLCVCVRACMRVYIYIYVKNLFLQAKKNHDKVNNCAFFYTSKLETHWVNMFSPARALL